MSVNDVDPDDKCLLSKTALLMVRIKHSSARPNVNRGVVKVTHNEA